MGKYLNPDNSQFLPYRNDPFYVDKSSFLKMSNDELGRGHPFFLFSRPKGWGKTCSLSMLSAYYSKGASSRELFKDLEIAKDPSFEEHLNKHSVLSIDFEEVYENLDNPDDFLNEMSRLLTEDLQKGFPDLELRGLELWDVFYKAYKLTGERFILLIDNFDVVFRESKISEKVRKRYEDYLSLLFYCGSTWVCFDLVYMVGTLPAFGFRVENSLVEFEQCSMLRPHRCRRYLGLTEEEVRLLCQRGNVSFEKIEERYGGQHLEETKIYSPSSVIAGIKHLQWYHSLEKPSAKDELIEWMNFGEGVLKKPIAMLLAGEKVRVFTYEHIKDLDKVDSPDGALLVLLHFGYLGCDFEDDEEKFLIATEEQRLEICNAAWKLGWWDILQPILDSKKLYEKTLEGNTECIDETLKENWGRLLPYFKDDDCWRWEEQLFLAVAGLSYYYVREERFSRRHTPYSDYGRFWFGAHEVEDLCLFPKEKGDIPWIIEIKGKFHGEVVIDKVKELGYCKAFPEYEGKVLLLRLAYDEKQSKCISSVEFIEIGKAPSPEESVQSEKDA